jgi:NitT/TauT family transport system ATP-binding protein
MEASSRASTQSVVVAANAVEKVFPGGVRALENVTLDIRNGEFVSLLGPSGCGKSTLLRMIAGLIEPTAGSVRLWPGGNAKHAEERRLAFVFQQPTLMPWASLLGNVRLPLDLTRVPRNQADAQVRSALELVGLSEFERAFPRQLSGGMQMRASIARALVTQPRLLLMDEPFGALDEITRTRLDSDIRDLWDRRKLTVVFVTHSIYEAVFLSTRVAVMSQRPGRILDEVRIDEPHPRTDEFRLTERYAGWCRRLSGLLARGSDDQAVLRRYGHAR